MVILALPRGRRRSKDLSGRQQAILDFITRFIAERGYPPSVREIGRALGMRSSSTVHGYLRRLEDKGFLRRRPWLSRAIEVTAAPRQPATVAAPIVGRITAGQPVLAAENVEGFFPLPAELADGGEVFLLRVRGDSMSGAGILDGDLAVVRRQDTAAPGDIVVALIGEEATVKRFQPDGDAVRLLPANPAYVPIVTRDAAILGRVVGLFRRLS